MAWPEFMFVFVRPGSGDLPGSENSLFVSLMQSQQWAEAVNLYETILRRIKGYPPALNALAMTAYENRDYETAFSLVRSLVKRFPENPFWLNNFALVAVARGELDVAWGALQEALRIAPKHRVLRYNQAGGSSAGSPTGSC